MVENLRFVKEKASFIIKKFDMYYQTANHLYYCSWMAMNNMNNVV